MRGFCCGRAGLGVFQPVAISSLRTEAAASREGTSSCGGRGPGEVAVLDMGEYFCDEAGAREGFAVNLREQCHTVGLFYVKNHGVSLALCEEMLASARKFFDLPACVKNELDYNASPQFRGYMKIGVENTAGLVDFREQLEFGPEENAEANSDGNGDTAVHPVFRRLRGPNQWPPAAQIPEFRPTAVEFMDQMNVVSMHLMQALASSLGLDHDFFDSTFLPSPHYQMKVARYPPKPTEDGNAGVGVFGVGPHSDTGFLSLLLQDTVGGLQARTLDGKWIDVPPVDGTLVVHLGEMLQLATHGYYLATVHRVLSMPGTRSRYSIPFFFNPCLDAEAKPMDIETVTSKEWRDTPAKGGESTHGGRNRLHPVFGMNTFKSFARSHPQVVKMHHPDLLDAHGRALRGPGSRLELSLDGNTVPETKPGFRASILQLGARRRPLGEKVGVDSGRPPALPLGTRLRPLGEKVGVAKLSSAIFCSKGLVRQSDASLS